MTTTHTPTETPDQIEDRVHTVAENVAVALDRTLTLAVDGEVTAREFDQAEFQLTDERTGHTYRVIIEATETA